MSAGFQLAKSDWPKRRLLPGCLIVLVSIPTGCYGWLWWDSLRGWTVERLEHSIQAEVPLGSNREFVEGWFEQHGLRPSWSEKTDESKAGNQTMPELAGLQSKDLGGMVSGRITGPEANVDPIFPGIINVYFFFDKQGRLVGHLVHPFVFMP